MTYPTPWRIVFDQQVQTATVLASDGRLVPGFTNMPLGLDPGAGAQALQDTVKAVNGCAAARVALWQVLVMLGRQGANADVNHALRPAWEACQQGLKAL